MEKQLMKGNEKYKRLKGYIVKLLYGDYGYIVGEDGNIYLFSYQDIVSHQIPKEGVKVTFYPRYYTEPEAVEVKIIS